MELLKEIVIPRAGTYSAEEIADFMIEYGVRLPVTCGECEHYRAERKDDKYGVCRYWQYYTEAPEVCADDFCRHGERRADNGT